MYSLTEGALDKIMNGEDVEKPVLQILGHKRVGSSSNAERFRLLVSDGKRINSFTMLATQLNDLINNNVLTEYSICQINRYAISLVNNSGTQKRVMVILNLELKVPGSEVGCKIGNPTSSDSGSDTSKESGVSSSTNGQHTSATEKKAKPSSNQSMNTDAITTVPIAGLSPYQNRWVIKARITNKSDIRHWSNSRGEGKLFSMDLIDESGEIRCTGFKEQCDKFYDMLEIGKVYYISRCQLKPANKQYTTLKNDYEMTLTRESEIIPCHDDTDEIPTIQFDFISIKELESKQANDLVDVLGVVKSFGDVQAITARATGRQLKKRDLNVVDETNTMINVTLWGTQAEEFNAEGNPVIAVKGARISDFNGGKSLTLLNSSTLQIDPDIPEAFRLKGWYKSIGENEECRSISSSLGPGGGGGINGPMITFKEAKDSKLGYQDAADNYIVKATINMLRPENAIYKSCPSDGCKKKLISQGNEMYRCEKCNREYPNYTYRLLASASLADWTDNQWVTAFSEDAEKLVGLSAQELGELQEMNKEEYIDKFTESTFNSFIFKLRVKMESFNDESRLKTTVATVVPMDYGLYNKFMLNNINDTLGIKKA